MNATQTQNTTTQTYASQWGAPSASPQNSTFAGSGGFATHQDWLVRRRNKGETPDAICRDLVAFGWDADSAAQFSLNSLRRGDRHRLLYITLCWGAGLAALGAGSAAHLALLDNPDPLSLAMFITLMLVAAPIALYAGFVARKVEEEEAHAIWSPTRRTLFATLAASVGVVGLSRLLIYTFSAVAAAVGAEGFEFTPSSVVQVLVTLSISVPLFWWSLTEWRRSNVALRGLTEAAVATNSPETSTTTEQAGPTAPPTAPPVAQ